MSRFEHAAARRPDAGVHGNSIGLRFVLGVGVAIAAACLIQAVVPQRVDASETDPDRDQVDQVALKVSDDGRTLEFTGPIVFGVQQRVQAVLAEYPGIATLRLISPGGRVVEARDLSAIVRAHGLATVAAGNCASACTVVFMAGRDRMLAPTGGLGFHRYRSPDKDQQEAEENMAIDRRYFSARGLPEWFIERAFATPNSDMWRPTTEEMRLANVITAELSEDGRRVPVGGPRPPEHRHDGERRPDGASNVNASEAAR